jgi:parallel beta-helix repeat protein
MLDARDLLGIRLAGAAAALCGLTASAAAAQQTVPFTPGMVVTRSVRIEPGTYRAPGFAEGDTALVIVRGSGIVVDMSGVRLEGIDPAADPDLAAGIAIRIDGGQNVTVRGAAIRGYRFAIVATGTRNLHLLDNDLSYNWKPRLFSQVGHESLVDWLSFHDNEDRQWMRFGAAVYLEDVTGGELRGIRAVQGMNAFLLTRSDSLLIRDNDASYNSGLGIGLYRSSDNTIVRNRFDYDVRGYSEGFYERGQDSAGLLVYEQSHRNIVAYNSATHSGDGFFLWAGNSTMETGEGGANDNLIFHNDFSYAPTNAIEVTFSRNVIAANILRGARYGVWGGYSWETVIVGNCFGGNRFGVAIEHGQDNRIADNLFDGDSLAVSLWARANQPADWGYPQHRDVRSRDYLVERNRLRDNVERWRLDNTSGLTLRDNIVERSAARVLPTGPGAYPTAGPFAACDPRELLGDAAYDSLAPDLPDVAREIPVSPRTDLPRSAMVVDAWGPYDGRSPKLWPADTTRLTVPLPVLGPPGEWRVVDRRGLADVSAQDGTTGDTLVVTPSSDSVRDWSVTLEYVGEATVSPRGVESPANQSVRFSFERFEPLGDWQVGFFTWADPSGDPVQNPAAFDSLLAGTPAMTRTEYRLDYQWFTPPIEGLPQARWALDATTSVDLPAGETYSLRTISDDAVRVWVDGELVIDNWQPHGSIVDYAGIEPGSHDIRVVHYQVDGWTEIRVEVVKDNARSTGSAGPH